MAAPKGNKFWNLRSKHGRDKLFASPELLWNGACEYFEHMNNNPRMITEQLKRTIVTKPKRGPEKIRATVEIPHRRLLSLEGLCFYLKCSTGYLRQFKRTASEDFLTVIEDIEIVIRNDQLEGAAIGQYNGNIVSRLLGLVDLKHITTDEADKSDIDYSKLSDATLEDIVKARSGQSVGGAV